MGLLQLLAFSLILCTFSFDFNANLRHRTTLSSNLKTTVDGVCCVILVLEWVITLVLKQHHPMSNVSERGVQLGM